MERRDIIMEEAKKESERQASERKISKRSEALVKRKYVSVDSSSISTLLP